MTRAEGCRPETRRAFASASAKAQSAASAPSALKARFSSASSTAAASTRKSSPAAARIWARAGLAEARINSSRITAVPAGQHLHDRCRGLLDRAPGHVDDRPVPLSEDPPRLAYLGPDRFEIDIVGADILLQHAEPMAAQLDQPFRVVGQADN